MSKEYLRQETLEPAKALGKHAGMGIGGAMVISLGAFFVVLGLFEGLRMWLPVGEWWEVLARLITTLVSAGVAGLVVWRMQGDDQQG